MGKKISIFSGIQPTGSLHLGNYLGAIKHWIPLQDNALFCVVDLHSLTVFKAMHAAKKTLNETTIETGTIYDHTLFLVATYLACGLDPEKCTLFCQSHVSAHAELAWVLSCFTSLGWLNRMTQFKEKSKGDKENANAGLYTYPILMAADILLYHPTHVPVGEDQKQHVELTRDIALSINNKLQEQVFTVPEPMIAEFGARIMSLRDGTQKMSKSDPSDFSRILLTDSKEIIEQKIKKAKTDPLPLPETLKELEQRPEARNLMAMLAVLSEVSIESIVTQYAGKNFSDIKRSLAEVMVEKITPIGRTINEYLNNKDALLSVLKNGKEKAEAIAKPNLAKIYQKLGLTR